MSGSPLGFMKFRDRSDGARHSTEFAPETFKPSVSLARQLDVHEAAIASSSSAHQTQLIKLSIHAPNVDARNVDAPNLDAPKVELSNLISGHQRLVNNSGPTLL
jgi:hypothetical protein